MEGGYGSKSRKILFGHYKTNTYKNCKCASKSHDFSEDFLLNLCTNYFFNEMASMQGRHLFFVPTSTMNKTQLSLAEL
jgi:hypothetical protein